MKAGLWREGMGADIDLGQNEPGCVDSISLSSSSSSIAHSLLLLKVSVMLSIPLAPPEPFSVVPTVIVW